MHASISDDNNGFDHIRNVDGNSESGAYDEETLYAVKWYKDNEEFYRYVPKANPPQHSYRVDGIRVEVSITQISILFFSYSSLSFFVYPVHGSQKPYFF